uniref:Estradiol 17-beta-dehydrogenase 1 n=1 Tax=Callithrix jacchus TaxID=9483 RepID=A0A5F4VZW9_CALJA
MVHTVVLITSCSSGISLHLVRSHQDLKTQGQLWEAASAQGCPQNSLETLQLDVRDSKSVADAQACVTEGRVDILVCNAGQDLLGPLEALGKDAMGSVLDVNVAGKVQMLQAFLPEMKRCGSGRVLVTGSMGGLMGLPFDDVYCASKFALEGLCESLAVLLPPFGVHLIKCGPVHTPFMQKVLGGPGWMLDRTDTRTRRLFHQFLQHNREIFREAAQHPEEVVEVSLPSRRLRSSSPLCAPRSLHTERFLPLQQMSLDDPSSTSYVAAMHRNVFPKEPAETEARAGAGGVGDHELGDPLAAPQ